LPLPLFAKVYARKYAKHTFVVFDAGKETARSLRTLPPPQSSFKLNRIGLSSARMEGVNDKTSFQIVKA
jgi:hypothetical protein